MYSIDHDKPDTLTLTTDYRDKLGRQVGGRAGWWKDGDVYRVRSQTTRDGKHYGAWQPSVECAGSAEAYDLARRKLNEMRARYYRLAARGEGFWLAGRS